MWYSGCIWPTRYTTTATIRPLNSSRQPVYLSVYPKHTHIYDWLTFDAAAGHRVGARLVLIFLVASTDFQTKGSTAAAASGGEP